MQKQDEEELNANADGAQGVDERGVAAMIPIARCERQHQVE